MRSGQLMLRPSIAVTLAALFAAGCRPDAPPAETPAAATQASAPDFEDNSGFWRPAAVGGEWDGLLKANFDSEAVFLPEPAAAGDAFVREGVIDLPDERPVTRMEGRLVVRAEDGREFAGPLTFEKTGGDSIRVLVEMKVEYDPEDPSQRILLEETDVSAQYQVRSITFADGTTETFKIPAAD